MSHLLPWVSALACVAMMVGAAAIAWMTARTPLSRVPWIARRARARADAPRSGDRSAS
jgi:hypothetical protein